jgi:hypothetical protein
MAYPYTYGYCEEGDALANVAWVPQTLSDTTKPTLAQCREWIGEVAALIDARLYALGYAVPTTVTAGTLTGNNLKHWSAVGVAGKVALSLENAMRDPGQRTAGQDRWGTFMRWLYDDNQIKAAMATSGTDADEMTNPLTDGSLDVDTGLVSEPLFRVRMAF